MNLSTRLLIGIATLAFISTVAEAADGCGRGMYYNGRQCVPQEGYGPPRYQRDYGTWTIAWITRSIPEVVRAAAYASNCRPYCELRLPVLARADAVRYGRLDIVIWQPGSPTSWLRSTRNPTLARPASSRSRGTQARCRSGSASAQATSTRPKASPWSTSGPRQASNACPHLGRYQTDRQPGAALQNTAICPAGPPARPRHLRATDLWASPWGFGLLTWCWPAHELTASRVRAYLDRAAASARPRPSGATWTIADPPWP